MSVYLDKLGLLGFWSEHGILTTVCFNKDDWHLTEKKYLPKVNAPYSELRIYLYESEFPEYWPGEILDKVYSLRQDFADERGVS